MPFRLSELIRYFLWLGSTAFGGPVVLVGAMQADLIDKRKWFTQETFKKGLMLSQMTPGPMATQLAMYLGWTIGGIWTAALCGIALVLPSFVIVVGLAIAYVQYGSLPWIERVFTGISPAVLAIVVMSAGKLTRKNLGRDSMLWIIAIVNALSTVYFQGASVLIFLISAFTYVLYCKRSTGATHAFLPFFITGAQGEASLEKLRDCTLYFSKVGVMVFGSGLVIVPFLKGGVVDQYHWLTERQFVDAVAVAMITPGPVVITTAFVGFLVAGFLGAVIAAVGVFLPCYLVTIFAAPSLEKVVNKQWVRELISGVTAAAIGAIAGGAVIIGVTSVKSLPAAALGIASLCVLIWIKKMPEPLLLLASGLVGYFILV